MPAHADSSTEAETAEEPMHNEEEPVFHTATFVDEIHAANMFLDSMKPGAKKQGKHDKKADASKVEPSCRTWRVNRSKLALLKKVRPTPKSTSPRRRRPLPEG